MIGGSTGSDDPGTRLASMGPGLMVAFRGLFELSPVGIVLADAISGQILEANDAFRQSTGYTPAELVDTKLPVLAPSRDRRFGPIERNVQRRDGTVYSALIARMHVT